MDFFKHNDQTEPQRGQLLISDPFLPDPNFERSVLLLCEHDEEEGSLGFILNKRSNLILSDILLDFPQADMPVFIGGPVEQNTLHYVHRLGDQLPESIPVANGLYWGGDYEELKVLINNQLIKEDDIRFFMGYSGWSEGQLVSELKENAWIISQGWKPEYIFENDPEKLWKEVLNNMGGKFKMFANYPADPRLN